MTTGRKLVLFFLAAGVVIVAGALFKVLHYPFADELLLVGMLGQLATFVAYLWWMTGQEKK